MNENRVLSLLSTYPVFGRQEVWQVLNEGSSSYSLNTANALLQRYLKSHQVARVGRNKYTVAVGGLELYAHQYSELATNVAEKIVRDHPFLDFAIFELIQLNRFVNHQIAHNVVFVSVEGDLGDFIFDGLKSSYPGHVLKNPSVEIYDQYWTDDLIIIDRLVMEAPKGTDEKWHTCLEKLLVDLLTEPLYREIIHQGEYPAIFRDAFTRYVIDESKMLRYARRRNAEEKLKDFIAIEAGITLRTV
ncbi:MAG: hypothetical protein IJV40_09200 [Oscillospiraceae bacterium]|nr:hypothetical protein [Oscillospiraceae bacterium]